MTELLEIVFEKVSADALAGILFDITEQGHLIENCEMNGETYIVEWEEVSNVLKFFQGSNDDFALTYSANFLFIGDNKIPECQIRVIRGQDFSDLEINFRSNSLTSMDKANIVTELMKFSFELAAKYEIENYYCGLEPAVDEETRFFTKDKVGPLNMETVPWHWRLHVSLKNTLPPPPSSIYT